MEDEEQKQSIGTIHHDIRKRADFLQNLIFKPKRRDSDSKPREKIEIGFDLSAAKTNWEEQDKSKKEELEKKLKSRVENCGAKGLVSKMSSVVNKRLEENDEKIKRSARKPRSLKILKDRWNEPENKTIISFGNKSPTLASLQTGAVREKLEQLKNSPHETNSRIVINLGSINEIKNALYKNVANREKVVSPTLANLKTGNRLKELASSIHTSTSVSSSLAELADLKGKQGVKKKTSRLNFFI